MAAADEVFMVIEPDGCITAIYHDLLADLFAQGDCATMRASHVEPAPGGWTADMAPMGGPVLGPFALRQLALDAEHAWLVEHLTTTTNAAHS